MLINDRYRIKMFIAHWSLVSQKGNLSLNYIFKENIDHQIYLFIQMQKKKPQN